MMLYCLRKPCRHLPPAFLVSNIMATHNTIMLLKEVFQQIIQRLSWEWNTKVPWVGVCLWLTAQITTRKPLRFFHLNICCWVHVYKELCDTLFYSELGTDGYISVSPVSN